MPAPPENAPQARDGPDSALDREAAAVLVEAIAANEDRDAFASLYQFYAPRVKGFMMRLRADPALAEELAQEVMLTVWRKAHLFDRAQASVSTWIFTIARNRRIDAARRAKRPELDPDDPALVPDGPPAPDAALVAAQREEAVRRAMTGLPEEQHALLRLAFYDGLTHSEIAAETGLPLGTVKSRLRLAFQKLKAALDGELE